MIVSPDDERECDNMSATTLENAVRLIKAATGEEYGDGYTVTDVIVGYAEPGYYDPDAVIVLGDWNPRNVEGEDRWTSTHPQVTLPTRLAKALERVGAELAWSDEWTQCQDCYRAVRTEPDSYHWKPSYIWAEDCGPVCSDCLIKDGIDAITGYGNESESYVNNPRKCLTWCNTSHVESFGFVKWEPGDEHTYENGWHPGQTDDPKPIFDEIKRQHPNAEVVFFLDESSQFYVRFSAYFREVSPCES